MQAIADAGVAERLVTIGRDLTEDTRTGLLDGTIRLVLSHPMRPMAAAAVSAMVAVTSGSPPPFQQVLLPFDLWTAENV